MSSWSLPAKTKAPKSKTRLSAAERLKLVERARGGDQAAFAEYRRINKGLMEKIIYEYARWVPADDLDDMRQEGLLGMMRGIERFKAGKANYCVPEPYVFSWVRAFVSSFARKHGIVTTGKYVDAHPQLDKSGDEFDLLESVESGDPAPDDTMQAAQLKTWFAKTSKRLLPKERKILAMRVLTDNPQTLSEVGEDMGISRERVRQIELEVREKLRRHVRAEFKKEQLTG